MFRSTLFWIFAFLTVSAADKMAATPEVEAKLLKWSQGLNAHFKEGFPNEKISPIDPFIVKSNHVVSFPLGKYKDSELIIEVGDYVIKGLGDRQTFNASSKVFIFGLYYDDHDVPPAIGVRCSITYKEITFEGKYVIYDNYNSSFPVIANVTGNLKFVLTGKIDNEVVIFKGEPQEDQAITKLEEIIVQYVVGNKLRAEEYRVNFTLGEVIPSELMENFVKSELVTQKLNSFAYYLIFEEENICKARRNICRLAWKEIN